MVEFDPNADRSEPRRESEGFRVIAPEMHVGEENRKRFISGRELVLIGGLALLAMFSLGVHKKSSPRVTEQRAAASAALERANQERRPSARLEAMAEYHRKRDKRPGKGPAAVAPKLPEPPPPPTPEEVAASKRKLQDQQEARIKEMQSRPPGAHGGYYDHGRPPPPAGPGQRPPPTPR